VIYFEEYQQDRRAPGNWRQAMVCTLHRAGGEPAKVAARGLAASALLRFLTEGCRGLLGVMALSQQFRASLCIRLGCCISPSAC